MKRGMTARVIPAAACVLLAAAAAVRAASAQWTGGDATDSNWAFADNWNPKAVPGTGDTATFGMIDNGNTTVSLGSGVIVNTVLFDTASAAAYTIGSGAVGSQALTLENGGAVTVNATVASNETFHSAIVLGTNTNAAAYTITNSSTTNLLTFAGGISRNGTTNTKTLNVTGGGNTSISGVIGAGAIALTKTGSGTLALTGPNTYTGATTISEGIVNVQNGSGLGTIAGGVTVGSGATLQIQGGITIGNEPLSLSGGFAAGATGSLQNVSGTNSYGGLLTPPRGA